MTQFTPEQIEAAAGEAARGSAAPRVDPYPWYLDKTIIGPTIGTVLALVASALGKGDIAYIILTLFGVQTGGQAVSDALGKLPGRALPRVPPVASVFIVVAVALGLVSGLASCAHVAAQEVAMATLPCIEALAEEDGGARVRAGAVVVRTPRREVMTHLSRESEDPEKLVCLMRDELPIEEAPPVEPKAEGGEP